MVAKCITSLGGKFRLGRYSLAPRFKEGENVQYNVTSNGFMGLIYTPEPDSPSYSPANQSKAGEFGVCQKSLACTRQLAWAHAKPSVQAKLGSHPNLCGPRNTPKSGKFPNACEAI